MRKHILSSVAVLLALAAPAFADNAADEVDILAARTFIAPIMAKTCQFQNSDDGKPDGDNAVNHLHFRTKGQDQDSPDYKRTLVRLACSSGAYNFNSIYLLRNDDPDEGGWELLTFAEPTLDYDYADEEFTKLKAPPKVSGYVSITELTNSEFDEASQTVNSSAKWRGIGDAWSSGEWKFEEGTFVLKRYEVDPTFQPPGDEETDPNQPESYTVFGDPRPAEPQQ